MRVIVQVFVHLHRCSLHFLDVLQQFTYLFSQLTIVLVAIIYVKCVLPHSFANALTFITEVNADYHLCLLHCVNFDLIRFQFSCQAVIMCQLKHLMFFVENESGLSFVEHNAIYRVQSRCLICCHVQTITICRFCCHCYAFY